MKKVSPLHHDHPSQQTLRKNVFRLLLNQTAYFYLHRKKLHSIWIYETNGNFVLSFLRSHMLKYLSRWLSFQLIHCFMILSLKSGSSATSGCHANQLHERRLKNAFSVVKKINKVKSGGCSRTQRMKKMLCTRDKISQYLSGDGYQYRLCDFIISSDIVSGYKYEIFYENLSSVFHFLN